MLIRRPVRGLVVVMAAVLMGVATGCAPTAPLPTPSPTVTASSTPTPTPTVDPTLIVGGTAAQNRPFFEFVLAAVLRETSEPSSQQLYSALAGAGFDPAAIEVTQDRTRVNDPADSILFGLLVDGQCLLGQVIDGELVTDLADVLGTGRCLVGRTASLD